MFLIFPDFNRYSNPLLLMLVLSLVFAGFVLRRYLTGRRTADALLAAILLTGANGLICYAIGFMDWYDTYRNTKINYFLINTGLLIGPLAYWYVRFSTDSALRWQRAMGLHFLPFLIYLGYCTFRYIYDVMQPGFDLVQNGVIMLEVDFKIVQPLTQILSFGSAILYFAFGIQHYYSYVNRLEDYFSNTERVSQYWLRNFLIATIAMIVCDFIFLFINFFIVELHWMQNWWDVLVRGIITVYLGMEGYHAGYVKTAPATVVEQQPAHKMANITLLSPEQDVIRQQLLSCMNDQKPWLNPELTLNDLAVQLSVSPVLLSQTINQGMGKNFNDFINEYRVEAVKAMLKSGKKSQLTLLGIAFECGFNSKATFNRAFKKLVGIPPGDWTG